jgi:hypothetical protein
MIAAITGLPQALPSNLLPPAPVGLPGLQGVDVANHVNLLFAGDQGRTCSTGAITPVQGGFGAALAAAVQLSTATPLEGLSSVEHAAVGIVQAADGQLGVGVLHDRGLVGAGDDDAVRFFEGGPQEFTALAPELQAVVGAREWVDLRAPVVGADGAPVAQGGVAGAAPAMTGAGFGLQVPAGTVPIPGRSS